MRVIPTLIYCSKFIFVKFGGGIARTKKQSENATVDIRNCMKLTEILVCSPDANATYINAEMRQLAGIVNDTVILQVRYKPPLYFRSYISVAFDPLLYFLQMPCNHKYTQQYEIDGNIYKFSDTAQQRSYSDSL